MLGKDMRGGCEVCCTIAYCNSLYGKPFTFNCMHSSHACFQVPLVPRLQNTFHAPLDPLVPVVMIGPGTGVAPFVGFLQHWRAQGKGAGPRWLFFGCRHPEKDYIYR